MSDPGSLRQTCGIKKTTGLYGKFNVSRTDGTDATGGKHDGCRYFVLDVTHDTYAAVALLAYAKACADEYPELARDLHGLRTSGAQP